MGHDNESRERMWKGKLCMIHRIESVSSLHYPACFHLRNLLMVGDGDERV